MARTWTEKYLEPAKGILLILCVSYQGLVSAAPQCIEKEGILNCEVSENSDFALLSSVADNIRLSFSAGHAVVFQDSLFPALPRLKTLTIDALHLVDLSSGAFRNLNALQKLQIVNTDGFRPLPELVLQQDTLSGLTALEVLTIEETGLTEIHTGAFQDLTSLTEFSTTGNKLRSLPGGTFASTKLESLTLTGIGQIQMSSALLQGLTRLKKLQFTDNNQPSLEASVFSNAENLEEINLENNALSTMSTESFKGLRNLTRLSLKDNNITELQYGIFSDLINLDTLDITNCQLKEIADGTFDNLGNLAFLRMPKNKLETIASSTLVGLSGLQFFEAEQNAITSIASRAFSYSPTMQIVHLYNNNISYIDPQAFAGADISVLTLHDNNLTTLPEGVFDSLQSLNLLDLSNNPWQCDCDITWLNAWIAEQKDTFVLDSSDKTTCTTGARLETYVAQNYQMCLPPTTVTTTEAASTLSTGPAGGPLDKGDDEDNSVLSKSAVTGIIVACILVALLILVLVAIAMYCRHKKYAFWAPAKVDHPDGKVDMRKDLKFKARHEVGSFYQDPETGKVSAMWETDSIQSFRYTNDPETGDTDSMKNRYVYENPALDVSDIRENNPVVVVDSNGTQVQDMPAAYVNVNGHVAAEHLPEAEKSEPSKPRHAATAAHGYEPAEPQDTGYSPPTVAQADTQAPRSDEYQMNDLHHQDETGSFHSDTPRAHSISSISDVDEAGAAYNLEDEVYRPDDTESGLKVLASPSEDYEHLHTEPDTPSSTHDYTELRPEEPGLPPESNTPSSKDDEHLKEPDSLAIQQDFATGKNTEAAAPDHTANQVESFPTGVSTEAHGGTAAYSNAAFDASDD